MIDFPKNQTSHLGRFVFTHVENMDPSISVRITTLFSGTRAMKLTRRLEKLYLRVGNLVVSQPKLHGMTYLSMLRNTLTAIIIYPKYLSLLKSDRSRFIHNIWEKRFLKNEKKKYMNLPLRTLLEKASLSLILIQTSICGGHLRLTFSLDVRHTIYALHNSVCTLTLLKQERMKYSEEKTHPSNPG